MTVYGRVEKETGRRGDGETGRRGDGETGRRGDAEKADLGEWVMDDLRELLCLRVTPSPRLPVVSSRRPHPRQTRHLRRLRGDVVPDL